ncbi:transporter substrate-binding domain-containing protein [Clostridium sp. DL1XJH146]
MKRILISLLMVGVLILGVGCGNGANNASENTSNNGETNETEVKTVLVGVTNASKPWGYLDENNELIGFDVDIAKEIDKRIEDVEFEYKGMEFSNLFLSLDSGKIDMIALEVERNEDRMAKFLFSDAAYNTFPSYITTMGDTEGIETMKDLEGKALIVSASTNQQAFADEYNAANGDAIEIVLASTGTSNEIVNQLTSGRAVATLYTKSEAESVNESLGIDLKCVGEPVMANAVYHVFQKDSEEAAELKAKVEEAVNSMMEDGTLSKISEQWLGEDYTKYLDK